MTAQDNVSKILRRADRGEPVADIADALKISQGYVYTVLREHRPDRERKPRERTSDVRPKILGLLSRNWAPSRIARVLGVARQYVYRVKSESEAA